MSREKGCKFCLRQGLPVLPIRPGIMASDDIFPVLPAELTPPLSAQGEIAWTGRLLREGFLFIWAESARRWINYFVTGEGYYYPLPEDGTVPPDVATGCVKPCISHPAELASASLITLPVKPLGMKNGLFWFCWSEFAWSGEVRQRHEEPAYRSEVMQVFDMDAWLAGGVAAQAISVEGLDKTVAEYTPAASSGEIPRWSASSWKWSEAEKAAADTEAERLQWKQVKPGEAMHLRQAAEDLLPGKGVMLLLQDPPAILQELSVIIDYELQKKVYGKAEYQRELALAGAIGSLEKGMREQSEHEFIARIESRAEDNSTYAYNTQEKVWIQYPALMDDHIKTHADKKWAEYEQYYDPQKVKEFQAQFNTALQQYNQQTIVPRTAMYLEWMQSAPLLAYFKHHFDPDELVCGFAYTGTVIYCIRGMQDKVGVARYLTKLLSGLPGDENNFLLRAFTFNHTELTAKLQQASLGTSDWRTLPWSWLADTFEIHLSGQIANGQKLINRLMAMCAGPLTTLITTGLSDKRVYSSLVAIGVINNKAMVTIARTATLKQFTSEVVTLLAKEGGITSRPMTDALRHYVSRELIRLEASGMPMNKVMTKHFLVMVDISSINQLRLLPDKEFVIALSKLLRSGVEGDAIQFSHWQARVQRQGRRGQARARLARMQKARVQAPGSAIAVSARSVHLGVVSSLLQCAALLITAGIDEKTLSAEQKEAHRRYYGGVLAFGSTVVATIETTISYYKLSTSIKSVKRGAWIIKYAGRAAGVAGGFICAAYDFMHAYDEFDKGRVGMGLVYAVSGVSGLALSFIAAKWLVVSGATGIVLAIIFIAATAILMAFTPDMIQKWLRQCLWRRIPASSGGSEIKKQQYLEIEKADLPIWPTMEMEIQQLNLALGNGE